jgi:hypothetical protein
LVHHVKTAANQQLESGMIFLPERPVAIFLFGVYNQEARSFLHHA